jgi:hypothetical protein
MRQCNQFYIFDDDDDDRSLILPMLWDLIHRKADLPSIGQLHEMNCLFSSTTFTIVNCDESKVKRRIIKRGLFDSEIVQTNYHHHHHTYYVTDQNKMFKTFAELSKTPLLDFTNRSFEECYILVKCNVVILLLLMGIYSIIIKLCSF